MSYYDQYRPPSPPPPGVTADVGGPNPLGVFYIVISIFLLVLATAFVAMRFYTKAVLTRAMGWDDCIYLPSSIDGSPDGYG